MVDTVRAHHELNPVAKQVDQTPASIADNTHRKLYGPTSA